MGEQKLKDWYGEFKNCTVVLSLKSVNSISESRNKKLIESTSMSHISIHRKVSKDMNHFCTHNRFAPLFVNNVDSMGVNTYCQVNANSTFSINKEINKADTREKQDGVPKRLKQNTKAAKLETTFRRVKSNIPTVL